MIKIEPPQGEPLRRRAPPGKSTTFPIAMLNSNKRAITLNLKHERGRALLFRMVERGDVLLENFAPGVMDRLGVGWEVLHRINPRLVYASGSGYGLTGPDRDNLAMDLTGSCALHDRLEPAEPHPDQFPNTGLSIRPLSTTVSHCASSGPSGRTIRPLGLS